MGFGLEPNVRAGPMESEILLPSLPPSSEGKFLLATCEYCRTKHVVDHFSGDQSALRDIYQSKCPGCLRVGFHAQSELEISDGRPIQSPLEKEESRASLPK
jgi:hypothetical protein